MASPIVSALFDLLPPRLRKALREHLPRPLVRRVGRLLGLRLRKRYGSRAQELESKLWGGFSEQALLDLTELERDETASPRNRSEAAMALARWWVSRHDLEAGYGEIVAMRTLSPNAALRGIQVLVESECLNEAGRYDEAREILQVALANSRDNVHLELAIANTFLGDDSARLAWINRGLVRDGFAPVHKRDDRSPLSIENIAANAPACRLRPDKRPLISVLVPSHAAVNTLHIALDGLLAQTWENLEIIVIDDCSVDGTFDLARRYADRDARVRVLRTERNEGAYPARNLGLDAATGEFVTVHDADDWSHPQKLESQALHLLKRRVVGNMTAWVRADRQLMMRGTARRAGNWVYYNLSSLMVRTQTLRDAGGWDRVRAGADSELLRRLQLAFGRDAIPLLHRSTPLSFALADETSLTRSGPTHVFTLFHGARRAYHEASQHWLSGQAGLVKLPPAGQPRAFPAPPVLLSRNAPTTELDLVFIMDFGIRGGAYVSTMNYVRAALRLGKRVGLFHWKRYDLDVTMPPCSEVRQLAQDGAVTLICPGETVSTEYVIVGYPVVLRCAVDLAPRISCKRFVVVTNQMSARLYSGGDPQYDPAQVSANVRRLFDRECSWVPISELVRDLMAKDGRYGTTLPQTWTPLIDTAVWCKKEPVWRGRSRKHPVVGRHARDHYTKWPTTAEAVQTAYCADQPCTVSLLGGAGIPIEILKRKPRNWQILPFGSADARTFLEGLDFYVHYPHEDYIEEFGRAVLEAMAIGMPVILPHVFRTTFGDAAIYAEPKDVWSTIESIWKDERAWLHHVGLGRKFVLDHSDWQQFEGRLAALSPSDEIKHPSLSPAS